MAEYIVYLMSGQTVKVTADSCQWKRSTNLLIFSNKLHEVAVFNVNNICGCVKKGEEHEPNE